jgi:hypothetical protein
MSATRSRRATALAALASVALVATLAVPAAAAAPAFEMDLPAGWACQDFDLHVAGYGDGSQVVREFDGRGGTVLYLNAGTGYELAFTNVASGATISTKSNGAVNWTAVRPDDTAKMTLLGHNVVILFPADGGPSTTLYAGRVVIDIAADGVWTVKKVAALSTDICAALAS